MKEQKSYSKPLKKETKCLEVVHFKVQGQWLKRIYYPWANSESETRRLSKEEAERGRDFFLTSAEETSKQRGRDLLKKTSKRV